MGEATFAGIPVDAKAQGMTSERDPQSVDLHYWGFQLLFMLGFLFHAAEEWGDPIEPLLTMVLIGAFLLFRRGEDWVFLGFVVLLALRNLVKFPGLANHSNVILFVCIFLIPLQLQRALRRPNSDTAAAVGTLRWVVVLMYFFAGFHKLNQDFFDPSVSCALEKVEDYFALLDVEVDELPGWMHRLMPFSVLVMELAPAVLLLFGRTQWVGIAMLLLIHGLLAPVGFADFSCLAMSFLWLFVPPRELHRVPVRSYLRSLAVSFIGLQLILAYWRIPADDEVLGHVEGMALILGFTPLWFTYFRFRGLGPVMHAPRYLLHWALLAFIVFFCMNNYLGLRTAGTLSMFSNLVTETERSNHLLLGSNPLKVFGFQDDTVEVLRVDRRIRGRYRDALLAGNRIPRVEFARILDRLRKKKRRGLYLWVAYRGQVWSTTDVVRDTEFDFDVPWWQKKLMKFRAIPPERPRECMW